MLRLGPSCPALLARSLSKSESACFDSPHFLQNLPGAREGSDGIITTAVMVPWDRTASRAFHAGSISLDRH